VAHAVTNEELQRKLQSAPVCSACGRPHQASIEADIATIDPEAAVYFDRDVAADPSLVDLCGPRFRPSYIIGLHAHYGYPGQRYVVYRWDAGRKLWIRKIPELTKQEAREAFQDLLIARLLSKLPVTAFR
jgi:hypothetical protein